MRSRTYSGGISLESGFLVLFEVKRGLCGVGDAVACIGVSVACWMDIVLCMQFFFDG